MFPPVDSSRRGFLAQAAVLAAGGAALGVALPLPLSAGASERVPDPIYAAIETHKAAVTAGEGAHDRYVALEDELHRNGRLRKPDRTKDETRRADEIDDEVQRASIAEGAAAIALLGADVTTLAGLMTLLAYVQKYDDDTYGEGWPDGLYDDTIEGTRCWHHYLVAKLAGVLPELMRGVS
jgi:hypothetical protein